MKKIYNSIKEILSEANSKQAAPKYTTQQYIDWAKKYADEHGVPHSVVLHSMFKETGRSGDPEKMRAARNPRSGASGVMQIVPKYAPHAPYKIDPKDLHDPEKNIAAGVRGLAYYYKQHRNPKLKEGETDVNAAMKALASYNAGENYVQMKDKQGKVYYSGAGKYIKTGNPKDLPRKETRDYIADYKDDVDYQLSRLFPKKEQQASGPRANVKPEKVEVKPQPVVQKTEVAPTTPKVEIKPQPAVEKPKPVEKTQGSKENPYTPGSLEHAFKQARIEGKPDFEFKGKKIKVELKKEPQGVNEAGMKNIYNAAKQILSEKAEAPSWGSNLMKVFKGETLTSPGREANLEKQSKAQREAEIAQINAQAAQRAKAEQDRKAAEAARQKTNQIAIAAISPKRDDVAAQASSTVSRKPEKQAAPKKELSPFEKEFARARANKEPTFTWHDKQGRPYQVATKLKGEEEPPKVKAVAPVKMARISSGETKRDETKRGETKTRSVEVSDDEMKDIDKQRDSQKKNLKFDMEKERERVKNDITGIESKPAEKTDDEKKSDELWGDIRKELENETPEDKKARDDRIKQYKKEWGMKDQTNEGKQMSINKKFNVSDALYSSVMEVMTKSSGGTVPKNEKQKKLAAMHGDPNMITHGDVLKARGVKMKEEIEQVDELSRGKLVGYIEKASKTKGAEAIARVAGIKKAAQKLKDIKKQSMQSEDVEQVDEISKQTLGSYISKSADKAREHGFYGGVAFTKGKLNQSDYHAKKELKRTRGLNKAVSRLTKEEVLDEAKKLISKHGEDQPISAKVYKDTEWNEYQVHYFKNGKHMGEGPVSYHGDDKEDAQNTAEHEVKRMNKSKGNADSIIAAAKKRAAGEHAMEERIVGEQTATYMPPAGHRVRMTTPPAGSSEKSSVQYVKKDSEIKQASQADSEKAKKDQNVKEDWVDSKGKFHKEAPPPGQVPSPDEGYRPPKSAQPKKAKQANTTKLSDVEEQQNMDTPGNSYQHQCAIHVKSESFGEGRTITTQHADPDENGNIAWYDVMFEHGIEKFVPTNSLEILVSESHMHSKRKKKGM